MFKSIFNYIFLLIITPCITSCTSALYWPAVKNYNGNDYATIFALDDSWNYQLFYYEYNTKHQCYSKKKERLLTRNILGTGKGNDVYSYKIKANMPYMYTYFTEKYGNLILSFVPFIPEKEKVYFLRKDVMVIFKNTMTLEEIQKAFKDKDWNLIENQTVSGIKQWSFNDVCPNIFGSKRGQHLPSRY